MLVAAYFVIWNDETDESIRDKTGAVWITIPGILNFNLTGSTSLRSLGNEHLASLISQPDRTGLVCAVQPSHIDVRMMVQHGSFTVHDNEMALDEIPEARKAVRRILIPPHARGSLRAELHKCGLTRSSLFPDIDNLARFINATVTPGHQGHKLDSAQERTILSGDWFRDPRTSPPPFFYGPSSWHPQMNRVKKRIRVVQPKKYRSV